MKIAKIYLALLTTLMLMMSPIAGKAQTQQSLSPQVLELLRTALATSVHNYSSINNELDHPLDPATLQRYDEYNQIRSSGKALLDAGNADGALAAFQKLFAMDPTVGMSPGMDVPTQLLTAQAYMLKGQYEIAVGIFRNALYDGPHHNNIALGNLGDPSDWMRFALALQQVNQTDEAIKVYNHAAAFIDYRGAQKQYVDVLLPLFGVGDGLVPYFPQLFKAMATTALSFREMDDAKKLAELQKATQLVPNSAEAWFYLGQYYFGKAGEASHDMFEQDMQTAIQLDNHDDNSDGSIGTAAKSYIKLRK